MSKIEEMIKDSIQELYDNCVESYLEENGDTETETAPYGDTEVECGRYYTDRSIDEAEQVVKGFINEFVKKL